MDNFHLTTMPPPSMVKKEVIEQMTIDQNRYLELRKLLLQLHSKKKDELKLQIQNSRLDDKDRSETSNGTGADDNVGYSLIPIMSQDLVAIEAALGRLELGRYGICLVPDCGDEIEMQRLLAKPFAIRCLKCEGEREGKKKKGKR